MREFEFLEPASVAEASRILADVGDDCRLMAGGTALLLAMLAPLPLIGALLAQMLLFFRVAAELQEG